MRPLAVRNKENSNMHDGNGSRYVGRGILGDFGATADSPWTNLDLNLYAPVALSEANSMLSLNREAPPVKDYFTYPNPFNFTDYGSMQDRFIWNKLMFEPKPLPDKSFYLFLPDPEKFKNFFDPSPIGPPSNFSIVPSILPPQLR
jgi:hypothetical protein